ncbi:histidine kinase [Meiothermus granaticius]|uniref:Sensor histidine kinase LiaS n=1 Tax=Meiothermus granaticius NBRC 107808 TaxID=1227551 RepID=A0A399FAX1_9DEIN|nr:histidine kinase [Meiothermus granaticius]RIH93754.1 Sensor histidine kinase LiaS [Meiothermus granaticius NBRC 107808]GEM85723.1 hypothetical protein MGR01S_03480 [Meiothermus granaticius NBRC 107808]
MKPLDPALLYSLVASSLDGIVVLEERWKVAYANAAACRILERPEQEVIGHSILEFIAPHYRAAQQAQATRGVAGLYDTIIRRPGGQERIVTYSTELLENPETSFAILRDVTEERQAQAELERKNKQLAALLEVSRDVALTLELKPLLAQLLEKLAGLVEYSGAAIFVLHGEVLELLCYHGPLPQEQLVQSWDLQVATHTAEVIRSRNPVVIPDVHADTQMAKAFRVTAQTQLGYIPERIGTWMGVPLMVRDRILGVLAFDHQSPQAYRQEQIELAQIFAQQAAAAIENAQLFEQAQGKAALEERARLARELHDSVSQALYGIVLGARAALNAAEHNPQALREPLDYILSLAQAGIAEMRALIFELRPESLAEEGLVAALARQAAALKARYGLEVETHLGEEPEIPLEAKEALYRIAQEALHNVVKHAEATKVSLRLEHSPQQLVLQVQDDGRGFDPHQEFPGHLGQRTMRERAQAIGARLHLISAQGCGTRVNVSLELG